MIPIIRCMVCSNYTGDQACKAYPQGIPPEILSGDVQHTTPYKGDQGIVFAPAKPAQKSIMAPSALDSIEWLNLSESPNGSFEKEEARDYAKEYRDYHGKPKQRKERAERNAARTKLGLKVGDPREADHKNPLSAGGSNSARNLRAVSRGTNRHKADKT